MRRLPSPARHLAIAGLLAATTFGAASSFHAPAATAAPVVSPTTQQPGEFGALRRQMHELMSEHTILAGIVTQKAATGAPDFQAAMDHLDQNSVMLSQLMGSLYGDAVGAQFLQNWREHIQLYLQYTLATGHGDMAGREQARNMLDQWVQTTSMMLASLNPNLQPNEMMMHLTDHVHGTLAAIDAFAAGNFEQHYDIAHTGFEHSFHMADALAIAIAQQFPGLAVDMEPAEGGMR